MVAEIDVGIQYDWRADIATVTNCDVKIIGRRQDSKRQHLPGCGGESLKDSNVIVNSNNRH